MSPKRVEIDGERCKGCGICVAACPKNALAMGSSINAKGYFVVELEARDNCTSCGVCALMCPDVALSVYRP